MGCTPAGDRLEDLSPLYASTTSRRRSRARSPSGGAAQGEPGPDVCERGDERVDIFIAVQWRGGQPQPLRAARHGRVIDWLDIDAVAVQQLVARGFAQPRIADHDRHDMALAGHHRQAGRGEAALEGCRAFLMALTFGLARLQVADAGERAGGNCRW